MGRPFISIDEELIMEMDKAGINNGKVMMLYGKILSLSQNDQGACMASNKYFAKVLRTDPRNIQKYIKTLKDLGFIKVYMQNDSEQYAYTVARFIYPQWKVIDGTLCHEVTDDSSYGYEDMDDDIRNFMSDPTNFNAENHELLGQNERTDVHPNKRKNSQKSIEYSADAEEKENGRSAPDVADAPGFADATQANLDRIKYFQSLSYDAMVDNKSLPHIVSRVYKDIDHDIQDPADDKKYLLKTFTGGFYQAKNTENITELIDAVLNKEIYFAD